MQLRPWMLASAAALLLAVGGISFMAGRANPTEAVAAAELKPHEARSIQKSTLPFHDAPDNLGTLQEMTPEEASALVEQLESDSPRRSE